MRSGELHLNAAGLITQGFAVAVKVVASLFDEGTVGTSWGFRQAN